MKYKKKDRPNEMPYLVDFAKNIGISGSWISRQLGMCEGVTSQWVTGANRPKDYATICPWLKETISRKLKADVEEWEKYNAEHN